MDIAPGLIYIKDHHVKTINDIVSRKVIQEFYSIRKKCAESVKKELLKEMELTVASLESKEAVAVKKASNSKPVKLNKPLLDLSDKTVYQRTVLQRTTENFKKELIHTNWPESELVTKFASNLRDMNNADIGLLIYECMFIHQRLMFQFKSIDFIQQKKKLEQEQNDENIKDQKVDFLSQCFSVELFRRASAEFAGQVFLFDVDQCEDIMRHKNLSAQKMIVEMCIQDSLRMCCDATFESCGFDWEADQIYEDKRRSNTNNNNNNTEDSDYSSSSSESDRSSKKKSKSKRKTRKTKKSRKRESESEEEDEEESDEEPNIHPWQQSIPTVPQEINVNIPSDEINDAFSKSLTPLQLKMNEMVLELQNCTNFLKVISEKEVKFDFPPPLEQGPIDIQAAQFQRLVDPLNNICSFLQQESEKLQDRIIEEQKQRLEYEKKEKIREAETALALSAVQEKMNLVHNQMKFFNEQQESRQKSLQHAIEEQKSSHPPMMGNYAANSLRPPIYSNQIISNSVPVPQFHQIHSQLLPQQQQQLQVDVEGEQG